MKQLALHLYSTAPSFKPEDFLVSESNQEAHQFVMNSAAWPMTYAVLGGPEGSGKSHLAALWAEKERASIIQSGGVNEAFVQEWSRKPQPLVIDHLDEIVNETELFHLLNLSKETKTAVLLAGREDFLSKITLPDLKSRLLAAPKATLQQPSAELLRALFVKHFSDRQLTISIDILQYLVTHVERSGRAVREITRVLDEHALEKKQKISLSFIRNYLLSLDENVNNFVK